jgi:hypothetical protein
MISLNDYVVLLEYAKKTFKNERLKTLSIWEFPYELAGIFLADSKNIRASNWRIG